METPAARADVDPIPPNGGADGDAAILAALLARVRICRGGDEELSHDIWWHLVDVPGGAAREIDGRREVNITAWDVALKPLWRPVHYRDEEEGRLLIDSIDRAADLARRVLEGWRWRLSSADESDADRCHACIHSGFRSFSAVSNTESAALIAAILEAKIAEGDARRARAESTLLTFRAQARRWANEQCQQDHAPARPQGRADELAPARICDNSAPIAPFNPAVEGGEPPFITGPAPDALVARERIATSPYAVKQLSRPSWPTLRARSNIV